LAEAGHENEGLKNPHFDAEKWFVSLLYIFRRLGKAAL
jgi:hypothetical protein